MQDLVAGQIDIGIETPIPALPQARAGRIKAFAITAKNRLATAPDIPTVDEAGLPGFYTASWYGIWVPKGTPKDVIGRLSAAVMDALADVTVRRPLAGLRPEGMPRQQPAPETPRAPPQ